MYVGETGRSLRSRINGHRVGIIKDGQSLLYKHFRLPGHSVADMKVQILEKIYHSSENPVNTDFIEDSENYTGLKNLVLQPHMAAMTK